MEVETVLVHDNGGRPFQVFVGSTSIEVKKLQLSGEHEEYIDLQKWENVEKIWVGFDACDPAWSRGNSVLFRISESEYVMIGCNIFSFSPLHEIVEFHSPIGRSDVPYPWALDSENNVYLLEGGATVDSFHVSTEMKENFDDSATSDLIYGEGKEHFIEKRKVSSDPYKELWFNNTIPKESVQKITTTIICERQI
jgi:hypothetical protein